MSIKRWVQIVLRFAMATVFSYAAATKPIQQKTAHVSATIYAEWSQSPTVRYAAICTEALLAIWLFSGFKANLAGVFTLAMLSVFTGLIILQLQAELPKPCGCFGAPQGKLSIGTIRASLRFDLLRNLFMMTGAAWLFLSVQRPNQTIETSRMPGSHQNSGKRLWLWRIVQNAGTGQTRSSFHL